ncbi:MAG: LysR family transcriptional regulator [Chitinophagaceae bacterium BSSC1]|nr:MAG: LysR family transcriptional regulator [Chitinophagaceae bacterium BSSC1]
MEIRHLKYFLTLAKELSFTKASEKLFIAQPPLSRQIKELEQELGTLLFNRNNKKVVLTEAGKFYQKEITQLLQNLDRINLKAQKMGQHISGEFRIAYISSTFSGDITELVKFLSAKYPFVNFRLYEVPTVEQVIGLEQGKIDLGIIRAPLYSPHIETNLWFRDSYSLVFNRANVNIKSEKEIAKLKDETFVFFNKEYAPFYYDSLIEICAKYGFAPKIVHESNNISSIIQLVKNGLGISIVPTNIVKSYNYPELGFLELKKPNLYTDILLATPKDSDSEIAREAIQFLLK